MTGGSTVDLKSLHLPQLVGCGNIQVLIRTIRSGATEVSIRLRSKATTMFRADIIMTRGVLRSTFHTTSAQGEPTKCHPLLLDIPYHHTCSIIALASRLHRYRPRKWLLRAGLRFPHHLVRQRQQGNREVLLLFCLRQQRPRWRRMELLKTRYHFPNPTARSSKRTEKRRKVHRINRLREDAEGQVRELVHSLNQKARLWPSDPAELITTNCGFTLQGMKRLHSIADLQAVKSRRS